LRLRAIEKIGRHIDASIGESVSINQQLSPVASCEISFTEMTWKRHHFLKGRHLFVTLDCDGGIIQIPVYAMNQLQGYLLPMG
jgi:hypothetical protein